MLLRLEKVGVEIRGEGGRIFSPVRDVSFAAPTGEITAIVGESGSGKTLTALAIMGLLPQDHMRVSTNSRILFNGQDLLGFSQPMMNRVRGREIGMVFQDPSASLNPLLTIGKQICEPLIKHLGLSQRQAWQRAVELLHEVGIPLPTHRVKAYPHELSGGQQQRTMLAMAIACQPKLLIADEPTSALDVTVQRQIVDLILAIKQRHGLGVVFISHDLALVAEIADRVVVMRHGEILEEGVGREVLSSPSDAYTRSLVDARTRLGRPRSVVRSRSPEGEATASQSGGLGTEATADIRLEVRHLRKDYVIRDGIWHRRALQAVKDVSFDLLRGETLGVVGESGSGKTTLAMMLMRLLQPSSGTIRLDGESIEHLSASAFRPMRRRIQIVFQNPYASLNPRWSIRRTLTAPMKLHGLGRDAAERQARAARLLERVGLSGRVLDKYPHQFSGGERQRIAIARCMAVEPEILICDECVSALDVSTQIQVLDLLRDLQKDLEMSYLFISHDLSTIRYMADRVLVLRDGEIVEVAASEFLLESPQHLYTQELLAAVPQWPASTLGKPNINL